MAKPVKIAIKNEGSITVIEIQEPDILDEVLINGLFEALCAILERNRPQHLVVSFAPVQHLSSMALGMLVRLQKRAGDARATLKLCDIKPFLRQVFQITKLDKVLSIYDTENAALDSLGA